MPELPEVEVIRRDLVRRVEGRRIRGAEIAEPRLTRRRGAPREVEAALRGRKVQALRRRGKFFVFDLGRDSLIVRFQAHPGRTAGGIFDCRILKKE